MKRNILTISILLISACSVFAQAPEKDYILNFMGGFSGANRVSQLSASARFGAFSSEKHFAFGVEAGYSGTTISEQNSPAEQGQRMINLGPFARYYFFQEKTGFFVGAAASYASVVNSYYIPSLNRTDRESFEAFIYGPNVGLLIFLQDAAALEFMFQYQFQSSEEEAFKGTALVAEFGISLFL